MSTEASLATVRNELDSIRKGLLAAEFTHRGSIELQRRLETAVSYFQRWAAAGPARDRETLEEIQKQLSELQPLFENAYQLQSGWYELAALGGSYDSDGKSIESPAATAGELALLG